MIDQKNTVLAIVLSVAIIIAFQYLVPTTPPPPPETATGVTAEGTVPAPAPAPVATGTVPAGPVGGVPTAPGGTGTAPAVAAAAADRAGALAASDRVRIASPRLSGSISLTGARIDDLTLSDYRETVDPDSSLIVLLSPAGTPLGYYAEFGWVAVDGDIALPGADTVWSADRDTLTPETPVTLSWDNGQGLRFERRIGLDNDYLFTMTQRVVNSGAAPVSLLPYGLVSRTGTPDVLGFYILHEGPLAVFDGTLSEIDYSDLEDDGPVTFDAGRGWVGITDKYWLVSLIPDGAGQIRSNMLYDPARDGYQVDYIGTGQIVVPAGGEAQSVNHLFAGAKEVEILDRYSEALNIENFDKAIDFGWFYFMTKPIFQVLVIFHGWIGNMGLAILLLTVLIKIAFFPLANKSYRSMSKMKVLQPEMLKLRERFGDDKQRLNTEMMQLYKRHKVTPAAGCLPILIQIPVFFALYKVLFVTIEMRQEPFFGWIQDLSLPDPTTIFNLFGLIPWDPSSISPLLMIGVWPLIMGGSMFLQQRLNPQPPDPIQAKVFMFLPIMFTFMLARFPAGLVIYWAWNNTLSIAQQWVIMKRAGVAHPAST